MHDSARVSLSRSGAPGTTAEVQPRQARREPTSTRHPLAARLFPSPADVLKLQRTIGNQAVQRLFGMEVESRIPVRTPKDEKIEGYPTVGDHENYKIDVDNATVGVESTSILEFVAKAFDEHAGSAPDAHKELDKRMGQIDAFMENAAAASPKTTLDAIASEMGATTREKGLLLNTVGSDKGARLLGPVHFTIGFALTTLPALLTTHMKKMVGDKGKKTKAYKHAVSSKKVLAEAADVAGVKGAAQFAGRSETIQGYLSLVYIQMAPLMDGKFGAEGLMKNFTVALARVPMDVIFGTLNGEDQEWLKANAGVLIESMRRIYLKKLRQSYLSAARAAKDTTKQAENKAIAKQFNEYIDSNLWGSHKKDKTPPPLVQDLFNAAFGGKPMRPDKLFGKMTVVEKPEPVGAPDVKGERKKGFALELRKVDVTSGDKNSRAAKAHELIEMSRGLHGTDAVPQAAPKPAAAEPEKEEPKQAEPQLAAITRQ